MKRILSLLLLLATFSCGIDEIQNNGEVSITGGATEITENSAKIKCYASLPSGRGYYAVGIVFSRYDSPELNVSNGSTINSVDTIDENNSYTVKLSGLSSLTTYYYRSFVKTHEGKTFYGQKKSFSTLGSLEWVMMPEEVVSPFAVQLNCSVRIMPDNHEKPREVSFFYSSDYTDAKSLKLRGNKIRGCESGRAFSATAITEEQTKYYYVSYSVVGGREFLSDVRSFQTPAITYAEALYTELGLSVKWAQCNLGASSPLGRGDYYAWGETEEKNDYSWATYKWCNGSHFTLTKYNTKDDYGIVGEDTFLVLDKGDDTASTVLGGRWRMPTDEEWTELRTKCTWQWVTIDGVSGMLVQNTKGYGIFLPASGYRYSIDYYLLGFSGSYFSSSLDLGDPRYSWSVIFFRDKVYRESSSRRYGFSVRPVME